MASPTSEETSEGIERDQVVSFLSRLAIVNEIGPYLDKKPTNSSGKPRVFIWGMPGTNQKGNGNGLNSEKNYSPMPTHSNTVAGNEALVLFGARQYPK